VSVLNRRPVRRSVAAIADAFASQVPIKQEFVNPKLEKVGTGSPGPASQSLAIVDCIPPSLANFGALCARSSAALRGTVRGQLSVAGRQRSVHGRAHDIDCAENRWRLFCSQKLAEFDEDCLARRSFRVREKPAQHIDFQRVSDMTTIRIGATVAAFAATPSQSASANWRGRRRSSKIDADIMSDHNFPLSMDGGKISVATNAGRIGGLPVAGAGGHSEVLFVDPAVSDLGTILGNLRPGVEAIVLDRTRPAARQMASALADRANLGTVHVIAHGAPGRVSFAAGEWSAETLEDAAEDFAAIGRALDDDGELRLWSCNAGAGVKGAIFVADLARATRADVAAASGLVGAAALGGAWELKSRSASAGAPPPLTAAGVAAYSGTLDDYIQIDTHGAPVTLDTGAYSLVARINGKTEVIGRFSLLNGRPHNILVKVATRSNYTVYAGLDGNLGDGQITIYDSQGNYSQRAALALLGPHGGAVAVRPIAMPSSAPQPTASARVADQSQSPANSRTTR
jgi:hypothetical protein